MTTQIETMLEEIRDAQNVITQKLQAIKTAYSVKEIDVMVHNIHGVGASRVYAEIEVKF